MATRDLIPIGAMCILLFSIFGPRPAEAARTDILVLDNDNWITGEILSLESGKLSFKTDNVGTLSVEWKHVAELKSTNSFTVETQRGEVYFGVLSETEKNQLKVVDGDVTVASLDMDSVVSIYWVKESFWSRLDGSLDVGYGYTQQNGSTQFNLNTSVYQRQEHQYIRIDLESLFSTQDDADSTTRNTLEGAYHRRWTGKWFYLGAASVNQNNGLDLDLRTLASGGIGRQLHQTNIARLFFLGGLSYNRELYTFNEDFVDSIEAFGGIEFSYFTFDGLTSQLTTRFIVVPSLTQTGRVRLQFDANYRQNLVGNLYWNLDLFETFDSEPPSGAAKNDFGITTSFGWSF